MRAANFTFHFTINIKQFVKAFQIEERIDSNKYILNL